MVAVAESVYVHLVVGMLFDSGQKGLIGLEAMWLTPNDVEKVGVVEVVASFRVEGTAGEEEPKR